MPYATLQRPRALRISPKAEPRFDFEAARLMRGAETTSEEQDGSRGVPSIFMRSSSSLPQVFSVLLTVLRLYAMLAEGNPFSAGEDYFLFSSQIFWRKKKPEKGRTEPQAHELSEGSLICSSSGS